MKWIWDPWREARESAGDGELAHSLSMATKEEERERTEGAEDSEAGGELGKRGVVDLATSPAGKTGSPSTTATHSGGELRETSASIPHPVRHREKLG